MELEPLLPSSAPASSSSSVRSRCAPYVPQFFAALAANMGAFASGTVMSWSATALPSMRQDAADLGELSLQQESLVASTAVLGALVSGPIGGFAVDYFGRRRSMLMLTLPFVLGWLLIYFAVDVTMIYFGRFLTGICGTAFTIMAPLYTSEIASEEIRGLLSAGFEVMVNCGILFMFTVGAFVHWRYQALFCAIVPVVFHLLMTFVPASPRYLLGKNRRPEAVQAYKWLHRQKSDKQVEAELSEIEADMHQCNADSNLSTISDTFRTLTSKPNLKPILIVLGIVVIENLSGEDPVLFFLVDIFNEAGSTIDSYTSAIIIAVIELVASTFAALTVDHYGRRFLLITSLILMGVSLTALAFYFHLKQTLTSPGLNWLPLTAVSLYIISDNIGLGPMIYLILGELLPHSVRGVASSFLVSVKWLLAFFVVQNFEVLLATIGDAQGISIFGLFCLFGAVFVIVFVPETKGKSLEKIQQELNGIDTSSKAPPPSSYGAVSS